MGNRLKSNVRNGILNPETPQTQIEAFCVCGCVLVWGCRCVGMCCVFGVCDACVWGGLGVCAGMCVCFLVSNKNPHISHNNP